MIKREDLFSNREFDWGKCPENLKESARKILIVAQRIPAYSVFAFNRKIDAFLNKIIKYPNSKDARYSISYFERENSVIGQTSEINSLIEPQKEVMLNVHFRTYSTNATPYLLSK